MPVRSALVPPMPVRPTPAPRTPAPPIPASPAYAGPAYASPAYASPAYASPAYASPAYASPAYASPAYASPAYASGHRHSSARPAAEPYVSIATARLAAAEAAPMGARVVVLDTGLAMANFATGGHGALAALVTSAGAPDGDRPDEDLDDELDAAAGHGTFIAGLIEQVAPGAEVLIHRVLHAQGDGDEVQIADAIYALPDPPADGAILNLSFGGYVMDHPRRVGLGGGRGPATGLRGRGLGRQRRHLPTLVPRRLPRRRVGGRGGTHGSGAVHQLRELGAGLRPGRGSGEQLLPGMERRPAGRGWRRSGRLRRLGLLERDVVLGSRGGRGPGPQRWPPPVAQAQAAVTRLIDQPALLRLPGLGTVINAL